MQLSLVKLDFHPLDEELSELLIKGLCRFMLKNGVNGITSKKVESLREVNSIEAVNAALELIQCCPTYLKVQAMQEKDTPRYFKIVCRSIHKTNCDECLNGLKTEFCKSKMSIKQFVINSVTYEALNRHAQALGQYITLEPLISDSREVSSKKEAIEKWKIFNKGIQYSYEAFMRV